MKGDVITVVGIDPGRSGAIATGRLIEAALPCGRDSWDNIIDIRKMPTTVDIEGGVLPDVEAMTGVLHAAEPSYVILEHVSFRPDLMIK